MIDKTACPSGPGVGRVVVISSPSFGAVSLSPAWVNEGAFTFSVEQPPAHTVHVGDGWFRESRWSSAVAVSLPDGVHLFNATDVRVALHLAGEPLEPRLPVDTLARLLVQAVSLVGVQEIRRVAAAWRAFERADSYTSPWPDDVFRREVRALWGSRRRMSRALLAEVALLDALRTASGAGSLTLKRQSAAVAA